MKLSRCAAYTASCVDRMVPLICGEVSTFFDRLEPLISGLVYFMVRVTTLSLGALRVIHLWTERLLCVSLILLSTISLIRDTSLNHDNHDLSLDCVVYHADNVMHADVNSLHELESSLVHYNVKYDGTSGFRMLPKACHEDVIHASSMWHVEICEIEYIIHSSINTNTGCNIYLFEINGIRLSSVHWMLWSWSYVPTKNLSVITNLVLQRHMIRKSDFLRLQSLYMGFQKRYTMPVHIRHILQYTDALKHNSKICITRKRMLYPTNDLLLPVSSKNANKSDRFLQRIGGGASKYIFKPLNVGRISKAMLFCNVDLMPYMSETDKDIAETYCYAGSLLDAFDSPNTIIIKVPLNVLAKQLSKPYLMDLAGLHNITIGSTRNVATIRQILSDHTCISCPSVSSVFVPFTQKSSAGRMRMLRDKRASVASNQKPINASLPVTQNLHTDHVRRTDASTLTFPPEPPSPELIERICNDFISDSSPDVLREEGCAICATLNRTQTMIPLEDVHDLLFVLDEYITDDPITMKERRCESDPFIELKGPPLAPGCDKVCQTCVSYLKKEKLPPHSLANGLWIGEIPPELKGLRFAEKLLIARVRHNGCLVRVSSGMHKLRANAVLYQNPIPKIYDILPPPRDELDEVLAIVYTGHCKPTQEDFKKTPFLVRRNKVAHALRWLKLNHIDYADITVSEDNLRTYPEDMPPVTVGYRPTEDTSNKEPESTGLDDNDNEEGISQGECPISVHGLTGIQLSDMDLNTIRTVALNHLTNGGKVLAVGHAEQLESIYNNPQLYPQIFPWLFPYGLGGIGNDRGQVSISEAAHKKHLLMYYDKRFQRDDYFPIISINHQQIKSATTGGFLLTKKKDFPDIADRLLSIDSRVLQSIANRMMLGERVTAETNEERACFRLINDIDHVAHHVEGSITSKKYMRNEVWSLMAYKGAPSWYITLTPADSRHPICLYYADENIEFKPTIRTDDDRYRLIANNPVAGARFFHLMVTLFIKHVLGVDTDHAGLYGETSAYYGTVEQQGRLTLHVHMMIWIKNSLTPQEIRDRIMDPNSDFQTRFITYLESVNTGSFMTGELSDVHKKIESASLEERYVDPTLVLPEPVTSKCQNECGHCACCIDNRSWWTRFSTVVDDLLYRVNRHTCSKRCLANKYKSCKARFPREIVESTSVEMETGSILLKKLEAYINTITPCVTYLFRSNTDVTSMLSGTAIKSVIAYTTEYVTKPGLKTHAIFDIIRMMLDRKCEMLCSDISQQEKARKLMTSIVNSMTSKLEIGGPMASLYLLGNPDHYTSHEFQSFYWTSYVKEVMKAFNASDSDENMDIDDDENVVLMKSDDKYVGTSRVLDYVHRPLALEEMSLYDWIRLSHKTTARGTQKSRKPVLDTIKVVTDEKSSHSQTIACDAHVGKHLFMDGHPLYHTHAVDILPERKSKVPNFIGATLPRRDRGDREYYCSTMLALFKPWRTGRDIKDTETLWTDAFDQHSFTDRDKDVMKFINIRYECLDARDDYLSQRKSNAKLGDGIPNINLDALDRDDDTDEIMHALTDGDDTYDDDSADIIGQTGLKLLRQSQEITHILRNAGWLDGLIDKLNPFPGWTSFDINIFSPMQWRAVLKNAKDAAIKARITLRETFKTKNYKACSNPKYIDQAEIVDQHYLSSTYKCTPVENQIVVDDIVKEYTLNKEQERAFRIVANHTSSPKADQLKMYLGGMAGTGKSQVIKALIALFRKRNEQHRFITLAPTGSAAALIDGSTYHYALGVGSSSDGLDNISSLVEIKSRLEGVDYIFLDEVSMLSCRELYKISEKLAKITNESTKPFGGLNMIFAGDFAQLKPVNGRTLYSYRVGTFADSGMDVGDQQDAIGKTLWHQVDTVVILRQNMRQKTQTARDAQFRTALENMRYKSCTKDDIKFLKTLVAGRGESHPKLAHGRFRHVSVITARNAHKDYINEMGTSRFAADYDQELTTFYAIDKWSDIDKVSKRTGTTKRKAGAQVWANPENSTKYVSGRLKQMLLDLPPSNSMHFAGKLSLCRGMPILLKRNEATECCVTNGAEAMVYDWISTKDDEDRHYMDVLFAKLSNPPRTIQLPGLPENVVPINKMSHSVECKLPNDQVAYVERTQMAILPNFAMTDYASQGRTRPNNVVDLNNCKDHLSYYTCLSRSSSADGTIIVQGFSHTVITGGLSGELKREFRELEVLDEVTSMKHYNEGECDILGHRRHDIIHNFQAKMGDTFVPSNTHDALRWTKADPFVISTTTKYDIWRIVETNSTKAKSQKNTTQKTTAVSHKTNGTIVNNLPASTASKHAIDSDNLLTLPVKKAKTDTILQVNERRAIYTGIAWDSVDYSCAYDALFNVLFMIWLENPNRWTAFFNNMNDVTQHLISGFKRTARYGSTMQLARNEIRESLHSYNPSQFPWGQRGASVGDLLDSVIESNMPMLKCTVKCRHCYHTRSIQHNNPIFWTIDFDNPPSSTNKWFHSICKPVYHVCNENSNVALKWNAKPMILIFHVQRSSIRLSQRIRIKDDNNTEHTWRLSGVIYYGRWHFTSISIDKNGNMWSSDSKEVPNYVLHTDNIHNVSDNHLLKHGNRRADYAIYTSM